MQKKHGLNRGLNSLLSSRAKHLMDSQGSVSTHESAELHHLPIESLRPGRYQPRREFYEETLEELAESIKIHGIIQPLVVRKISEQHYEIIAGERRFRAAALAGLSEVPVVLHQVDEKTALALALIENIQRENLNPLEEANALQRLMLEFQLTQEETADVVGKSRSAVANLLRITKLNPDVKTYLEQGDLDLGHAKVLLALEGVRQSQAAREIIEKNLSVRDAEMLVKRYLNTVLHSGAEARKNIDPNVQRLEQRLSEQLGARVLIKSQGKNKGLLTIHYHSLEELDGIIKRIH